jgi:hypothetical protein
MRESANRTAVAVQGLSVSKPKTDLEKFLEQAPYLRKWVVECISCHHRGYKPEMLKLANTAVASTRLRRLIVEQPLDEAGVCGQCRQVGQAKESFRAPSKAATARSDCKERERLDATYMDALRAKDEV